MLSLPNDHIEQKFLAYIKSHLSNLLAQKKAQKHEPDFVFPVVYIYCKHGSFSQYPIFAACCQETNCTNLVLFLGCASFSGFSRHGTTLNKSTWEQNVKPQLIGQPKDLPTDSLVENYHTTAVFYWNGLWLEKTLMKEPK